MNLFDENVTSKDLEMICLNDIGGVKRHSFCEPKRQIGFFLLKVGLRWNFYDYVVKHIINRYLTLKMHEKD